MQGHRPENEAARATPPRTRKRPMIDCRGQVNTGLAQHIVSFGDVDTRPWAPLHRRLGIRTYVHRQAILHDLVPLARGSRSIAAWSYDADNDVYSNNHLFRASITLARVFDDPPGGAP